jgi:hypothetical protein
MNMPLLPRKIALRRSFVALTAACLVGVLGCSKATEGTVTGKVMFQGKPLQGGTVKLWNNKGADAFNLAINNEGVCNGTNVPPGEYKVTIEPINTGGGSSPMMDEATKAKMQKEMGGAVMSTSVQLPAKVTDPKQTDLTWSIKAGKNDTKTFDIKE